MKLTWLLVLAFGLVSSERMNRASACVAQERSVSAKPPDVAPTEQDSLNVNGVQVPERFGAESNPTGDPLGGGDGYRHTHSTGHYVAGTAAELVTALKNASSGQVVFVTNDAEIDLTGLRSIKIPGGVTLASGRGTRGTSGGLLYTTEDKKTADGQSERFSLFETDGENVQITGLRLRGPDDERRGRYEFLNSDGVLSENNGLVVSNCEVWGWSHGGIYLRRCTGAHIHHNSIHHCQRSGLGYGVVLDAAEVKIEANIFDWCRHAIASTGRKGSGYEARYNLVLQNANGHSFDMHGGKDRRDGTNIAGDWMKIHHNTFKAAHVYSVVIRGQPQQQADIHHNRFATGGRDQAVKQMNAKGNVLIYSNRYGVKKGVKK